MKTDRMYDVLVTLKQGVAEVMVATEGLRVLVVDHDTQAITAYGGEEPKGARPPQPGRRRRRRYGHLRQHSIQHILDHVMKYGYRLGPTAKSLGVSGSTLGRRLHEERELRKLPKVNMLATGARIKALNELAVLVGSEQSPKVKSAGM